MNEQIKLMSSQKLAKKRLTKDTKIIKREVKIRNR